MKKTKIKKNDQVLVIAGKDRGSKGKVLRVFPARELAVVERVNMVKRHTRQNAQKGIQGGVLEKEAPIRLSNLMLIDPNSGKPTRVGRLRQADGTGVRVAKKSGATLN
ncbi:MAG: 50S ribosomal protein L24 [Thermoanaerobaculia bacterium]|jgi:large subunit ribosomal protein L24